MITNKNITEAGKERRFEGDNVLSLGNDNTTWSLNNILSLAKFGTDKTKDASPTAIQIVSNKNINNTETPRTIGAVDTILKYFDMLRTDPNNGRMIMPWTDVVVAFYTYMQMHPDFKFGNKGVVGNVEAAVQTIKNELFFPRNIVMVDFDTYKEKQIKRIKNDSNLNQKAAINNLPKQYERFIQRKERWQKIYDNAMSKLNSLKSINNTDNNTQTESIRISKQQLINIITESVIKILKQHTK